MAVPTWTVEIAFASDPLSTSPTWVDVSSYVLTDGAGPGITISRGRTSPLDDFRTGRASFRLRNDTRLFDPLYASGTYYGQLLPGKQVRIRATANAVTTDQFRGFIKGWPQSFDDAGKWAYVDVECYDGLGWLSEARATDDVLYGYASTLSIDVYLQSFAGDGWRDRTGGTVGGLPFHYVTAEGAPVATACDLPGVSAFTSAVSFDGRTALQQIAAPFPAPAWFALWFRTDNNVATQTLACSASTGFTLSLTTAGAIEARTESGGSARIYTSSLAGLCDGAWHMVAVAIPTTTTYQVYIDGNLDAGSMSTSGGSPPSVAVSPDQLGARYNGAGVPRDRFYTGSLALLMARDTELTAIEVLNLYAIGRGTFAESTTARTGRILDAVGWPSAWRDLTATPAGLCSSAPFNNAQATTLLREVEATEQGRLFVAKDGDVTLFARYYVNEATRGNSIQATFSDDGADIAYQAGGYSQDVDDVLNDVTVVLKSGASSNSANSASITAYGRKSETINTLLPDLTAAASMAAGVVTLRKDVLTRFTPVQPALELSAANWSTVLGLELGDRVRLEMTPGGVGSQLQQSATVEGIGIQAHLSHTQYELVAAPIPTASWFRLDSSALDGADLLGY